MVREPREWNVLEGKGRKHPQSTHCAAALWSKYVTESRALVDCLLCAFRQVS